MGILYVDTLEPQSGTTLTVGETGQNTVVGGNTIKLNTLKDAGGNTLFTSDGSGTLSSVNSGFGGSMVLIQSQTGANVADISFTTGITSSYGEYIFKFYGINPATDNGSFGFQASTDGGSSYGVTITSTFFDSYNAESGGTPAGPAYEGAWDLAQSTSYQAISQGGSNEADHCSAGTLHIFNPSSTVYMKQFYARTKGVYYADYTQDFLPAGYFNTASALNAFQFKCGSGNFDGTIKMFGVK